MGQEFFIKSADLENKVRELLPSQGGLGAGFDLTASTQIIPIIDLTESASGSSLRQDLQTAFSHDSITAFNVNSAATVNVVNNVGFFRIFGNSTMRSSTSALSIASFELVDGASSKILWGQRLVAGGTTTDSIITESFDFIVSINAGQQLDVTSSGTNVTVRGSSRQIADSFGSIISPL